MATALVGKQRFEKATAKDRPEPAPSTRRTSANTSTGDVRYCTLTVHTQASNDASSNGTTGEALRSCTTNADSCGLSSISTVFIPSPTTSPSPTCGRCERHDDIRSSTRPPTGSSDP